MIMVESGEVELGWRASCKKQKQNRLGDWKRVTHGVIEFLLRLISHIHFIIPSSLHASVCCRRFVPISVCIHGVLVWLVCALTSHIYICTFACLYAY